MLLSRSLHPKWRKLRVFLRYRLVILPLVVRWSTLFLGSQMTRPNDSHLLTWEWLHYYVAIVHYAQQSILCCLLWTGSPLLSHTVQLVEVHRPSEHRISLNYLQLLHELSEVRSRSSRRRVALTWNLFERVVGGVIDPLVVKWTRRLPP